MLQVCYYIGCLCVKSANTLAVHVASLYVVHVAISYSRDQGEHKNGAGEGDNNHIIFDHAQYDHWYWQQRLPEFTMSTTS